MATTRISARPTDPTRRLPHLQRVGGEGVLLVGAQRALLMEIAHPTVAAGVDDHSDFTVRPVTRLAATLDAVLMMVWGDSDEAARAVDRVSHRHDHVNGRLQDDAGDATAGCPYSAHDRNAQVWVWATLVDTADLLFTRYVRPYRPGERAAVYGDWCRFALDFGIPERLVPTDLDAFDTYVDATLHGDTLVVTDTTRRVARDVIRPPIRWVPSPTWNVLEAVAAAHLPPVLRDRYDLPWGPRQQQLAGAVDRALAATWHRLPRARRLLPDAYLQARRIALRLREIPSPAVA
jgi:uncharacterized protein (DUF2236 family)